MIAIIAIVFIDSLSSLDNKRTNPHHKIERIISLSPSTTETLFALGLGNKVVGRTRFCNYPPEAKSIKEVGGYVDPNYEAMIALQPDLVILLPEQEKVKQYLNNLNVHFLEVNNKTIQDIKNTIKVIGDSCNVKIEAEKLLATINKTITTIKSATKNLPKPKVLISIGRTFGTGTIKDVYIAGKNTFYDELISLAGGINAFQDSSANYPMLSAEGIIHLNPQLIIDFVTDVNSCGLDNKTILNDWKSITSVDAVINNNVKIFTGDYIVIPGPRFILLLKDLAKAIHPDIKWDK